MKYILGVIIILIVIVGIYLCIKKDNIADDSVAQSTGSIIEPYMAENEDKLIERGLAGDNEALFEVVEWGVKTTDEKTREYLLILVERNYPPAIRLLAMAYESGWMMGFSKDCEKASVLYTHLKEDYPQYYDLEEKSYNCPNILP